MSKLKVYMSLRICKEYEVENPKFMGSLSSEKKDELFEKMKSEITQNDVIFYVK